MGDGSKQKGGRDCGVYGIATSTALAHGHQPYFTRATVVVLCVCVCGLCVCVSVFSILPSCAFRCPTRGISGYSAGNAVKLKNCFL